MNHDDYDDDREWATLLDAMEPDATELAAAEHDLGKLGQVPRLPEANIELMVAAATATAAPVLPLATRRRHLPRLLLLAALALLALPSVAWFSRGLWADTRLVMVTRVDEFNEALAVCIEPQSSEEKRMSALSLLINGCDYAARMLLDCRQDADEGVRAEAETLLGRARRMANDPVEGRPRQVPDGLVAAVQQARDTQLSTTSRRRAMATAGELLIVAIHAARAARFSTPEGRQSQQFFEESMRAVLGS